MNHVAMIYQPPHPSDREGASRKKKKRKGRPRLPPKLGSLEEVRERLASSHKDVDDLQRRIAQWHDALDEHIGHDRKRPAK